MVMQFVLRVPGHFFVFTIAIIAPFQCPRVSKLCTVVQDAPYSVSTYWDNPIVCGRLRDTEKTEKQTEPES